MFSLEKLAGMQHGDLKYLKTYWISSNFHNEDFFLLI